jgi:hypothetical protein
VMSAPATAMQREAVGLIVVAVLPAIALLPLLARLPLLRLLLAAGDEGGQAIDVAAFAAGLLRALAVLLIMLMMLVLRLIVLMLRLIVLMLRLMLLMLALLIRPVMIALLVGLIIARWIRRLLHLARIMRLTALRLGIVI